MRNRRRSNVVAVAGVSAGAYVVAAAGVLLVMHLMNKSKPVNGLDGWGKKFKKAVKKTTHVVSAPVKQVAKVVAPVAKIAVTPLKISTNAVKQSAREVKRTTLRTKRNVVNTARGAVAIPMGTIRRPKKAKQVAPSGTVTTQYQDADGNIISEARYNELMAQANAAPAESAPEQPQVPEAPASGQSWVSQMSQEPTRPGNPLMPIKYGGSGVESRMSSQDLPSSAGSSTTVTSDITSTPSVAYSPAPAKAPMSTGMKIGAMLLIPVAIGFMGKH